MRPGRSHFVPTSYYNSQINLVTIRWLGKDPRLRIELWTTLSLAAC